MLVVETLDYLTKSTFANYFNELESECNMITFLNSIISFLIVKTVIY